MPDENPLTLRQANQARTDFAIIESDLEFLMQRIARLPTAADLWRRGGGGRHCLFPLRGLGDR
jgi:hypothetical protein